MKNWKPASELLLQDINNGTLLPSFQNKIESHKNCTCNCIKTNSFCHLEAKCILLQKYNFDFYHFA
jgi:hypothetical protein